MKIIHIMGMDSTKYGGVESFMYRLIKECQYRDIETHIVYNSAPRNEEFIADIKSVEGKMHIIKDDKRNIFKFISLIKKVRPNIIHLHFGGFIMQLIHVLIAYMYGVKVYRTVHCCEYHNQIQVQDKKQFNILLRIVLLDGKIYNLFSKIFFISRYVMNQYISIFGYKKSYGLIYLGVNQPKDYSIEQKVKIKADLGIKESEKVVTTVLFANPIKGPDIYIKSLPHIKDCELRFIIIGLDDSEYTVYLKELAKELGIYERIVWLGIVNNVSDYLSITDIYVQPSRTEALSLGVCEALSYGVPCIASNVGGLPEVASLLFESEHSEDLADKINYILNSPKLMKEYGEESYRKYMFGLNIENGVKLYADFYISR